MPTEVIARRSYGVGPYGSGFYGNTPEPANTDPAGYSGRKSVEQWQTCDRCGFNYPLSKLRLQQGDSGQLVVCIVLPCYDEPSRDDMRPDEYPQEAPLSFVDE